MPDFLVLFVGWEAKDDGLRGCLLKQVFPVFSSSTRQLHAHVEINVAVYLAWAEQIFEYPFMIERERTVLACECTLEGRLAAEALVNRECFGPEIVFGEGATEVADEVGDLCGDHTFRLR